MNANEPAFPGVQGESGCGEQSRTLTPDGQSLWVNHNQGLTKREYFAAVAMNGILAANSPMAGNYTAAECDLIVAREAVKSADALIAELNKPTP